MIIAPIEISVISPSLPLTAEAADQIALALIGAGVSVTFPGRDSQKATHLASLQGAQATIRTINTGLTQIHTSPPQRRFDIVHAGKIGASVILILALLSAEVRLNFGLRFDTVLLAALIFILWRWSWHEKLFRSL